MEIDLEMFDHVCLEVSDFETSKKFYSPVMEFLGYRIWISGDDYIGYGTQDRPHFWLNKATGTESSTRNVHIAFPVKNRETVCGFFRMALENGGISEGQPGLRPEYHENYYGAFVLDPEGNNIEAVCHQAE